MKCTLLIIALALGSNTNLFGANPNLTSHASSESLPEERWINNPVGNQEVIHVQTNPSAIIVRWDRSTPLYQNNAPCKKVLAPILCTTGILASYLIYLACVWTKFTQEQKNSFHNDVSFFVGENFRNYEYNNPAFYFNLTLIIGTLGTIIQSTRSYCRPR